MTEVSEECLVAVRDTIRGLSLTDIDSQNVVDMFVGDDQAGDGEIVKAWPCVICTYVLPETRQIVTNVSSDWTFPVTVALVSGENREQATNRARNRTWRRAVVDAFDGKRLAGVTGGWAYQCNVTPGTWADRPAWLQGKHFQVLVINVIVRIQRPQP